MKDVFNYAGHITEYGFDLLINGEPTELQRLEIAEHLDFCDECVVQYMDRLENVAVISPMESVSKGVFSKLRREARKIFFNRYGMVAVAASFTMIMWVSGAFNIDNISRQNLMGYIETPRMDRFVERSNSVFDDITDKAKSIFNSIESKEVNKNGKK